MTYPGNVRRSGARLIRLHCDLHDLANRLRAAGLESEANGVADLARKAGHIGVAIERKIEGLDK